ncbi:hypothetical protein GCM10007391_08550 [Alteromonas halophila]|uniref:histidine kinase n=1 Tax=Alteromonas halophila TaxID=516698 RepID=A0A918JJ05_9ALTE|nr:hypothetical protein GCM10007391_08550 [Alteromonas halophila]
MIVEELKAVNNIAIDELYSVSTLAPGIVLFAEKNRVIKYNTKSLDYEATSISKLYPKLSSITSLYSKGLLYIGGPEGIYVEADESAEVKFYAFSEKPVEQRSVTNIFAQKDGKVWVAAEELYQLSERKEELIAATSLTPMLNSYAINTVTGIAETSAGEILVNSTQQGLIVLPPGHEGIHFLHKKDNYFHHDDIDIARKEIFSIDEPPIVLTRERAFQLQEDSGLLREVKISSPVGIPRQRKCWLKLNSVFTNNEVRKLCWQKGAHIVNYSQDKLLVYGQNESEGKYHVLSGGKIVDEMTAPLNVTLTKQLDSGELISLDENGQVHIQISRFNWKLIPAEEIGSYVINCIVEWKADVLWLCTSGNGVIELNLKENTVQPLVDKELERFRFVRSGTKDSEGNIWLATNMGLVVYRNTDKKVFRLGAEDGIVDKDFHYDGMYLVDDKLILMGDKYSYLLDTKIMMDALAHQSTAKYSVKFLSFTTSNESEDELSFAEAGDRYRVNVEPGVETMSVVISPTNYTFRHHQRIEYRVKGMINDWQRSDKATATLTFSDLKTNYFIIEARVVDTRSQAEQPVSSLYVYIRPPFYLSWQAYLLYSALVLAFGFYVHKRYQNELREQVSQYSAEVFEQKEELAKSQQSIRHLVDAKQRLFTNISHELKTPLALIVGVLRKVSFDKEDEKQRSQRDILFRNAERVESLVQQLVEVEKLDSIRQLPKREYNVNNTVYAIVQSFAGLTEQRELTVDIKIHGKVKARLLEDTLEQVLSNLLGNAIKYTPDKGRIVISAAQKGTDLRLQVKDNGVGIDDKYKKTIFERFTRIEEVDGVKGVGVGLALINEIVKANKGWIELKSEHGEGSCFSVFFPQAGFDIPGYTDSEKSELKPNTDLPKQAEALQEEGSEDTLSVPDFIDESGLYKVLIVEDDRDFRSYVYNMLISRYACFTARTGKAAIDVFKTVKPHIVLTDCRMPDMDGLAFARYIRTQSDHPQTPIILLTAYNSQEIQEQRFASVVDCMLSKSLMEHELISHINNLISLRELTEQHLAQQLGASVSAGQINEPIPYFTNEKDQVFYTSLLATLEKNYTNVDFNRAAAAKALNMSERQLNRRMAVLFEYNFAEYLKRFRIKKAKIMLCEGRQITATAMDVGFCTASYFSNCFKDVTGLSPRAYQEANRNAEATS